MNLIKMKPRVLFTLMVGAACFSGVSIAAQVEPPPKPKIITVVEPGESEQEKNAATRNHHHKGQIKKDKTREAEVNTTNTMQN